MNGERKGVETKTPASMVSLDQDFPPLQVHGHVRLSHVLGERCLGRVIRVLTLMARCQCIGWEASLQEPGEDPVTHTEYDLRLTGRS